MLAGRLERLVEPGDVSDLFPSLVTRESETRRDLESYADQWMIAFGSDGFTDVRPDDGEHSMRMISAKVCRLQDLLKQPKVSLDDQSHWNEQPRIY